MRKIVVMLLCLFTIAVSAQDNKDKGENYKSIIKFSPLQFIFNTFQLGWEIKDVKSSSIQFNLGVCYLDNDTKYKEGYIGEFQYRMYVLKNETSTANTMHNLYLGPYLNYKHYIIDQKYYSYNYNGTYTYTNHDVFNAYNFGVLAGINSIIAKRFHIDFYFGGGLRTSDSNANADNIMEEGYKGIAPRFGFDLGVNF